MDALLTLKNMNIDYLGREKRISAVQNVSLTLGKNSSLGIVGESGSGKSTLAMGILGLLPREKTAVSGQCFYGGTDILSLPQEEMDRLRWVKIAAVFQKAMTALSPVHRIGRHIEDIYRVHRPEAEKKEIQARAQELFRILNLPERTYRLYPHELSGGMLQRVMIAVSLLFRPELVIFDEATTALDVVTQKRLLTELTQLEEQMNFARIMITHDITVVAGSCSRIAVMYAGELMETGPSKEVLTHPAHPYTKGLLAALPSKDKSRQLTGIAGVLPDLSRKSSGCVFAARCPYRTDRCENQKPVLEEIGGERMVACLLTKDL